MIQVCIETQFYVLLAPILPPSYPGSFLGKTLVLSGHVTLQKLIAQGGVAKYQITCLKMLL